MFFMFQFIFQLLIALLFSLIAAQINAQPYLPTDGQQIIERLPSRSDPAQRELQRLRQTQQANPNNPTSAAELARRYIEQARRDSDPRYYGYAQAALTPWWQTSDPPAEVRVLRATLLQSSHQFGAALKDLDALLKTDRGNPQAWLTRATILTVQGESAAAKTSCAQLSRLTSELITVTCIANVGGVAGQLRQSMAILDRVLRQNPDEALPIRLWATTLLAEMAQRAGDPRAAQAHFEQALQLDQSDSYLLGAYADFLLDQQRSAAVIKLLADKTRADALLLRYALALKQQQSPQAARWIAELRARFEAAAQRGDSVHLREQARFELQLAADPKRALSLAEKNFEVQKEPADVRILMQAALAANDLNALNRLRDWVKRSGLEDVALTSLLSKAAR